MSFHGGTSFPRHPFSVLCVGNLTLNEVDLQHQGPAPASSHTGPWGRDCSLISPGLAAQLAPNFPLWLSLSPLVPAWTYRGFYSKYNTAYFSSIGSLSSPSQAESRGLFSTWKAPFALDSPN